MLLLTDMAKAQMEKLCKEIKAMENPDEGFRALGKKLLYLHGYQDPMCDGTGTANVKLMADAFQNPWSFDVVWMLAEAGDIDHRWTAAAFMYGGLVYHRHSGEWGVHT